MRVLLSIVMASLFAVVASATVEMPMIISHRGESGDRPENSMAAYRLAFERGVDGVECDVYATTDGKGALIHDATTGRTAGSANNLTVTSCSWDELKDIAIGNFSPWAGGEYAGETIPLLDDYLALLSINSTTKCVIELKDDDPALINVVVTAIQAQPLATKDRVIFISFETAQIAAIRTALPDYEAWLLLKSGTYSGETMVSKIRACNATGIDVSTGATYSADDVATVKAAGFKFAVWVCDDATTAFSFVEKGAQAITTNTGKALKDALTPLVNEVLQWAEIYDPAQPRGAKLWDVGDYVQSGLVAHFDGIRNVGAAQPHDSGSAKWKNLASDNDASLVFNNRNGAKKDASNNSETGGFWLSNGYYFNYGCYAQVGSNIALGRQFTIQLATDVDYTLQAAGTSIWPNLLSLPSDNFSLYYNNSNGTKKNAITWKEDSYGGSTRPTLTWSGKSLTAMFDADYRYISQDGTSGTKSNRGARVDVPGEKLTWGGSGSANDEDHRWLKGAIHALRIYNRALTEEELAQNYHVDEIRYRGNGANVIVESNVAGLEGTDCNGNYTVNGTHTFTAPASVERDGRTWAPTGYKVELWDSTKLTWNVMESVNAPTFVYTNCSARAKVRLTWNWRLAQGVKRIDADDYVQAGLVQQFDGIRNAGLDQPHVDGLLRWRNLSPNVADAFLKVSDAAKSSGAWHEKGYDFQGGTYFAVGAPMVIGRQATAQVACDYNDDRQFGTYPMLFGAATGFKFYVQRGGANATWNRGDRLNFNVDPTTGFDANTRSMLQPWHGRIANVVLDYNRSGIGQNASIAYLNGSFKGEPGSKDLSIGTVGANATDRKNQSIVARIYAVRLYDRVLSPAELAHNLEVDNIRFFAGAGRSTDTDLVEVTSELPVYKDDDFGCWIVRGAAVAKTVTAPATVETANALYTCAGYRLETWNATNRMWENPQTVANATSCTLQGTENAANRRVTWLWTCTSALRTAADYDVHSYVQQGLVAHYDGIHNRGADMPHATKGMGWRDLSYRDNLMVSSADALYTSWTAKGLHFNENGYSRMQDTINLGQAHTEQGVMDVDVSKQGNTYPNYISIYDDYGIFTRNTGNTLELKYDNFGGGSATGSRATYAGWTGKYINNVITASAMCLFEGTTIPTTTPSCRARSKYNACNGYRWAIGASGDKTDTRKTEGDFYAVRFYNRALSNDELALNRKVDEIRYRGAFAEYCNLEVSREQPFEGAEATSSVADGSYEVVGEWTFTADDYEYEQPIANSDQTVIRTLRPHYMVSYLQGDVWTRPQYHEGNSFTYTAGSAPVKLVWSWTPRAGTLMIIR